MVNGIINIAFIGAGNMAFEHLRAFSDIPGVKSRGIFSRSLNRAQALAERFSLDVYASVEELYRGTGADLVIIAVPEMALGAICSKAFRFPWACLLEKPVGYDLDDGEVIAEEAARSHADVFVGLNRRQYPSTRFLLEQLATYDGRRMIHIQDQESPAAAATLGKPRQVVEKWMYANSIHIIDYLYLLGRGKIVSVTPIVPFEGYDRHFVAASVYYSSGDVAIYEAVWDCPGPWAVTITTPAKRWELRPIERISVQEAGSRSLNPVDLGPDNGFKPGIREQAVEAIKALRGQPHNLPSISEALETMRLVRRIYGI